jgi:hypothetical protein
MTEIHLDALFELLHYAALRSGFHLQSFSIHLSDDDDELVVQLLENDRAEHLTETQTNLSEFQH